MVHYFETDTMKIFDKINLIDYISNFYTIIRNVEAEVDFKLNNLYPSIPVFLNRCAAAQ